MSTDELASLLWKDIGEALCLLDEASVPVAGVSIRVRGRRRPGMLRRIFRLCCRLLRRPPPPDVWEFEVARDPDSAPVTRG